jgi:F-type H+-transporting ATPase subunit b
VIDLNWTFFLQGAVFVVLLLMLNRILFRPILKVLSARKEEIDGSLQRAKDLESEIAEKMSRYQERLQEARLKGSQEKAALRQEAAIEEGKIVGQAQQSASDNLQQIKSRVAAEAEEARLGLRGEVQALATGIASKVLGRAF